MTYKIKKDPIKDIPKAQFIFWIIVRISLLICITISICEGNYKMMGESIACFLFSHLWDFFQVFGNDSFIVEVPPLSQTMLNIIIFAGIPFGSYMDLFDNLWFYDIIMHTLSGFVSAVFAYDFAVIIQRKKGKLSVTLAAIFSLMFALSIAVGWEFYEFLMDTLHDTNLQLSKEGPQTAMYAAELAEKYRGEYGYLGLVDTMTDMMNNTFGGILGMIFMIILRVKGGKKNKK